MGYPMAGKHPNLSSKTIASSWSSCSSRSIHVGDKSEQPMEQPIVAYVAAFWTMALYLSFSSWRWSCVDRSDLWEAMLAKLTN